MAEEAQEVGQVNWRKVFGFTHVFGSFRLSRHMTKLVIALLAVLLTWGVGKVMDVIFTPFSDVYLRPVNLVAGEYEAEPDAYWRGGDFDGWRKETAEAVEVRLGQMAAERLADSTTGSKLPYDSPEKAKRAARTDPDEVREKLCNAFEMVKDKAKDNADDKLKQRKEQIAKEKDADEREKLGEAAEREWVQAVRDANAAYVGNLKKVDLLGEQGPFATFSDFEGYYFRQAIEAVLHGHIFSGFNTIGQTRRSQQRDVSQVTLGNRLQAGRPGEDPLGLLACLALMAGGIAWFVCAHWVYGPLFLLALLVIWSLAGGAIARAAALQATRDEKAGIGECLRFALKKFFSFLASPLVPLAVFLVIVVLTAVIVSILGAIPGFGGIWIGLTFGLALISAVLLAFLLIGLVGGGLLMCPTIAVEGSDTFDACTRSYQFVLARPWRAGLYGLVAAGYGTICYLFVRFLLFLVLLVAHMIVGLFASYTDGSLVRAGASKWDLMWSGPTFENFHSGVASLGLSGGLNGGDWFGGWMVWCWVGLVSALLVAWVISYVISASTYIYLLLRRVEDATGLDEVYVEEPPEEPPAPGPAETPAPESAPETAAPEPTAPAPPEAGPAPEPPGPPPGSAPSDEPPAGGGETTPNL